MILNNIKDGDIMVINHNGRDCVAIMYEPDYFYVALGWDEKGEIFISNGTDGEPMRMPDEYEILVGEYLLEKYADDIATMREEWNNHALKEDELYIRECNAKVRIPLLPYLEGTRECDFSFPVFHQGDTGRKLSSMFDGYMATLQTIKNGQYREPYLLSAPYVKEMVRQSETFGQPTNKNIIKAFSGVCRSGLIVFKRNDEDLVNEIGFSWDACTNGLRLFLIAGEKMMFYYSTRLFDDDSIKSKKCEVYSLNGEYDGTHRAILVSAMSMMYWFVCMERYAEEQIEREIGECEYDSVSDAIEAKKKIVSPKRYILRDATWYNAIWCDKKIEVGAHKSHRWKRSSANGALYLAPVDVRGLPRTDITE